MRTGTIIRATLGVAVLAGLGVVLFFATRPPPLIVQGEVTADEVDISPRVSGRVSVLHVDVGDKVEKGDVLVELANPELIAALTLSKAALEVAKANLANVETVRPESVTAQRAQVAADQADVELNQATYNRQQKLIGTGYTAQSNLDQAIRNLQSALKKKEADEAQLALTIEGASDQQRELSETQVKQALASVNQQAVDVDELTIHAPISGEITTRVAESGENFSPGAPVYSIVDLENVWFTFNLREDLLAGLKVGDTFPVAVPALDAKDVAVRVTVINVEGQYATWRATRATGDFDLRTFEVRAKPVNRLDGLRPGMSAIAHWQNRRE